jgi:iron complex transport system ATP-binding protein
MSELLEARDVSVRVAGRELVRGLSVRVEPGQVWAIVGRNGAGKTLLLETLAGIRPPSHGEVHLLGEPLKRVGARRAARNRAYLPQALPEAFPGRVLDIVMLGRHAHMPAWGWESVTERTAARAALAAVDAEHLAARDARGLSGGEAQRVAIATALMQDAPVMLLDEPLAHLDLHHRIEVLEHIQALVRSRSSAVVLSMHELDLAARFATHAMIFETEGTVRCGAADEVLTEDAVSRALLHPLRRMRLAHHTVFVPA